MHQYKLVSALRSEDLTRQVTEHLNQGFKLVGGPLVLRNGDKPLLLQAVAK